MTIIAIDPGTVTGWASPHCSGTWDLTPLKAAPTKGRSAEREEVRCGRLFAHVLVEVRAHAPEPVIVVVEGAAAFMRGKAAVRVSHELRGAIKAACYETAARYEEVQPHDWKKALFGRGDVQPNEYLHRARATRQHGGLGYEGTSEDEAAALWLREWGRRFVNGGAK